MIQHNLSHKAINYDKHIIKSLKRKTYNLKNDKTKQKKQNTKSKKTKNKKKKNRKNSHSNEFFLCYNNNNNI